MTPQEFLAEYVSVDWEDYVCLVMIRATNITDVHGRLPPKRRWRSTGGVPEYPS